MGLKGKVFLFCILGVAAVWGCAPNNQNHAPVCPYGQVLSYSQAGYNCNFVSLVPAGYNPMQASTQAVGPGAVLNPPIAACPGGQTLVDWSGSWFCYFTQTIYPPGGSSPQTAVPPEGLGGEYCTGNNTLSSNAYLGVNSAYTTNLVVGCSPGFTCQPGGAGAAPTMGYPTQTGLSYGVAGTCVYGGYNSGYIGGH